MPSITKWKHMPSDVSQYAGFVYLITNEVTGKKYVGRKYFWKVNRIKVAGSSRRRKVTKESTWRYYKSSSKKVQEDIKLYGEDYFTFEVVSCHETRAQVNEREVQEQFVRNVLHERLECGAYAYYNESILSRYFRPKEEGTPEYDAKCTAISSALLKHRALENYVHPLLGKPHPNRGKKLPQTKTKTCMAGWYSWTDGSVVVRLPPDAEPPAGFWRGGGAHKNKRPAKKKLEYEKNPALCVCCGAALSFRAAQAKAIYCSSKCANISKKRVDVSGTKNPMHKWIYHTPVGTFYSAKVAALALGCSDVTVRNRCRQGVSGYLLEPSKQEELE